MSEVDLCVLVELPQGVDQLADGHGVPDLVGGMATPVPVANGGTGASSAKAALNSLGIFYAATLPSTGTDGQICLVPV